MTRKIITLSCDRLIEPDLSGDQQAGIPLPGIDRGETTTTVIGFFGIVSARSYFGIFTKIRLIYVITRAMHRTLSISPPFVREWCQQGVQNHLSRGGICCQFLMDFFAGLKDHVHQKG